MRTRRNTWTLILSAALCSAWHPQLPAGESWNKETPTQRDQRLKWWRDARFGMFIHWGLYAIPGGQWQGKAIGGIGEWIMNSANIPVAEYERLAQQFNPVKYDPAEWVRTAKEAGIRYLVITSKHHDGFCLFNSQATNYNVAQATPYAKDLLKPLADECRKQGLKFCVYYSVMDWHHPAQDRPNAKSYNPTKIREGRKREYLDFMKAQLKELLQTCDPEVLWFDGEWPDWYTEEDGREVYRYLRELKPHLIVNNRVGKGRKGMEGLSKGDREYAGDFGTPEQQIPATGIPGLDWESCMTMNDTWGFKRDDHNWKSAQTLIRNLIDIASKGGNYLLNVGPTAAGQIPEASVERLRAMGQWMKVNGESIYGTQASPFAKTPWGRCTQKKLDGGKTRLYLHVFDRPQDGKLVLPPLVNKPLAARLLAGGQDLKVTSGAKDLTIQLPAELPCKIATVIALDIEGDPKVATVSKTQIHLPAVANKLLAGRLLAGSQDLKVPAKVSFHVATVIAPAVEGETQAAPINPYGGETPEQRDARMKWWREARFGLFVHWGVYSVPAGTYQGKQIGGIGEWIMHSGRIAVAEYRKFAKEFNPVKFDAEQWVQLVREAGMKYIVITSKHHDGFAMFNSQASDWNIVKASPFGRDPLKELSAACQKHGIKLGFYYSQAQDWNNPGGAAFGGHWDKAQDGDMTEYIRKVAVPQVREILSNYGPIAVLWWDTPADMTKERADLLLPLLRLQPGIIHNNRLGGGYRGDTETPEQFIPPTGYPGRDWETCMTMNDTWGYKSYDQHWKTTETLIRNLVDIASKGGNYLLNVGPTSEGLIPEPSVERLKRVGQWMQVNGAAIYATSASPFKRLTWGRCTKKLHDAGATLYLHVFQWPSDGRLLVPGLKNPVEKAFPLADASQAALKVEATPEGVSIALPGAAPDAICSVIALRVKGELEIEPILLAQQADGSLTLPATEAICHGELRYESGHNRDNIGFWLDPKDWVEWQFQVTKPGKFALAAEIAATGSGSFVVQVGDSKVTAKAPTTGDYGRFQRVPLGEIEIASSGKASLAVKPIKEGWQPFNLKSLTLQPVAKP